MRYFISLTLAFLNINAYLALQYVSPPPDRAFDFFTSSRSQGHQSSQENTIVIQSKPYNISNTNESIAENAKLRRNIYVNKEENSEENYTEPKLPYYAIDCGDDKLCLEAHGMDSAEPTFKPYTQEELEKLLAQYAASHGKPPEVHDESATNKLANLYMDDEDTVINVLETNPKGEDQEKSKSAWHLLQSQKHNHPFDDKKGWVTLEPVAWAQGQVQKWEPNPNDKPPIPSWESPSQYDPPSHWGSRPSHDFSSERPWDKPSYEYKPSRPQWNRWTRPNEFPERPSQWEGNPDIITDDRPGYFPGPKPSQRPSWYDQESYSSNRPTQIYEDRPVYHSHSSHPSEGNGQWVLLSSTKGYAQPHRRRGEHQRALSFNTKTSPVETMSSHRSVRLTVLPADNSTNTTLSHGGLLEVESSFQTVEEAQREHAAKMLKLKTLKPNEVTPTPTAVRANSRRHGDDVQMFAAAPSAVQSKTAVLAAIGAGMIPATMAMLLPMVLGRKRRSVRDEDHTVNGTHHLLNSHNPSRSF